MTVEQGVDRGKEVGEQWDAGTELVDKEDGGCEGGKLAGEADLQNEMELASYGTKDGEAGEEVGRNEDVATYADVKCTWLVVSMALERYREWVTNHLELRQSNALYHSGK